MEIYSQLVTNNDQYLPTNLLKSNLQLKPSWLLIKAIVSSRFSLLPIHCISLGSQHRTSEPFCSPKHGSQVPLPPLVVVGMFAMNIYGSKLKTYQDSWKLKTSLNLHIWIYLPIDLLAIQWCSPSDGLLWYIAVVPRMGGSPRDVVADDKKRDGQYEIPRCCISQLWCSRSGWATSSVTLW